MHSRTADLDVRLDLPPVPDSADLSGLAIKVECLLPVSGSSGLGSASFYPPSSGAKGGQPESSTGG